MPKLAQCAWLHNTGLNPVFSQTHVDKDSVNAMQMQCFAFLVRKRGIAKDEGDSRRPRAIQTTLDSRPSFLLFRSKVGRRVWPWRRRRTRIPLGMVLVLSQTAVSALALVARTAATQTLSGAGMVIQIVILVVTFPAKHSPEHKGDASKEDCTTDAANDATND